MGLLLVRSLLCACLLAVSTFAVPANFSHTNIFPGVVRGTSIVQTSDERLFVAELGGAIKTYKNGASYTIYTVPTSTARAEQGLFSLVADPNFASNGWMYVHYFVYVNGGDQDYHVIMRLTVSPPLGGNPQYVAGSDYLIYRMPNLPAGASRHNGGNMVFGSDGYLYIPKGEGEHQEQAENTSNVFGSLIRINAHSTSASNDNVNGHYGIPAGNAGLAKPEIFSYGFRNPWSIAKDPSSSDIYIGDVGGTEEINRILPAQHSGKRFGWGPGGNSGDYNCGDPNFVCPMLSYGGGAITGVTVKRPLAGNWPAQYNNTVFYSDHNGSWIRYVPIGSNVSQPFHDDNNQPLGLTFGIDGSLYYCSYNGAGGLWKISYDGVVETPPTITSHPASATVNAGNTVSLSVAASGINLAYQWQKAPIGSGTFSNLTASAAYTGINSATLGITASEAEEAQYRVVVSNGAGFVNSNAATLTVNPANAAPLITFTSPAQGSNFTVPNVISFSATASDAEQGTLPASAFYWEIEMGHRTSATVYHTHPVTNFAGVTSGSFNSTVAGETSPNVWLFIILTVTDNAGNIDKDTLTLNPNKTVLTVQSVPVGLQVVAMDILTTNTTYDAVIGNDGKINANTPQYLNGVRYDFDHWSFSGDVPPTLNTTTVFQNFVVPSGPLTVTAHYTATANPAYTFKAVDNEYVSLLADARLQPNPGTTIGNAQLFEIGPTGDGVTVTIKSLGNNQFCQTPTADADVICNLASPDVNAAKWTQLNQADGRVAFRNLGTNNHLVAEGGGSQPLKANRGGISDWEKFTLTLQGPPPPPPTTYGITMAVESGSGTLSPVAGSVTQVVQGGNLSIVATPAAGYVFEHWHVSAGLNIANANTASTQLTNVQLAGTVEAHFSIAPPPTSGSIYAIRANANNQYGTLQADTKIIPNSATVAGTNQQFEIGSNADATMYIKAVGNGMYCQAIAAEDVVCNQASVTGSAAKWTQISNADGTASFKNMGTNNHLVAEGGGAQALKANRAGISGWEKFTLVLQGPPPPPPTTYAITLVVDSGSGTLSPTAGSVTQVAQGGSLSITATPAAGYVFAHWHVSAGLNIANANSASTQITNVTVAGTVQAHFSVAPPTTNITKQAESAVLVGAIVAANQTGYNGTGFADYVNASNDYVQWTVNATTAGNYSLSFRYALAGGNRPLKLTVNGVDVVASLGFPASGAWTTWTNVVSTQPLIAGSNTIRLTAIGSSGPNVDELVITGATGLSKESDQGDVTQSVPKYFGIAKNQYRLSENPIIKFGLADVYDDNAIIHLQIFDIHGKQIAQESANINGSTEYHWQVTASVRPGLYYYQIYVQGLNPKNTSGRMLLLQ